MNEQLKNRLKSFGWRLGMMIAAVVVDQLLVELASFNLGTSTTVILGLFLGEVSKFLNTQKEV